MGKKSGKKGAGKGESPLITAVTADGWRTTRNPPHTEALYRRRLPAQ